MTQFAICYHKDPIPKGYKLYTMFLISSYDWSTSRQRISEEKLWNNFYNFGLAIGKDNLSIWFATSQISHIQVYRTDVYRDIQPVYWFSWDSVPGDDNEKLRKFLKNGFDIEWIDNSRIHKSKDGTIISIYGFKASAKIIMDAKEKKATLKFNDHSVDLRVKTENGRLIIYQPIELFETDIERCQDYCDKFELDYNEGPFIVIIKKHPDESSKKDIIIIKFNNISPNKVILFLNKLEKEIRTNRPIKEPSELTYFFETIKTWLSEHKEDIKDFIKPISITMPFGGKV